MIAEIRPVKCSDTCMGMNYQRVSALSLSLPLPIFI